MDWKDRNHSLIESFRNAFKGIKIPIQEERNLKIHLLMSFVVVIFGLYYHITSTEWLAILLCIGAVVSLELMNYAIERTVDLFCQDQFHPLAKKAKDTAAGAVLVAAIIAVIIGLIVFIPYIFKSY